ncbi:MAG: pyruvate kinase [Candidatus Doudnabacteria bacterium]
MKKTKIVATIGPASHTKETLTVMIKAGMNVARLNFSHGSYASHAGIIKNVREISSKLRTPVAILQDLSGPKLRLGEFKDKELKKGQHVVFGQHGIPVGQPIWEWMKSGQAILIDDGLVELIATKIHPDGLEAKVTVPGKVISHKGVSLPGVAIHLPILSNKDLADLEFGLAAGVDFVAMSFVKTSFDIAHLRQKIRRLTSRKVQIIAKIETPEALKNIERIIQASDAVMVARGDMALNINQTLVPLAQKNIVKKCLRYGKPVIVATQMLDSMIRNPRPTRAELLDVGNAALDHVDAVMLSGESAFGAYPVAAVETMSKILIQTEPSDLDKYHHSESMDHAVDKEMILSHSLVHFGIHAKIDAVLTTDFTVARDLSHFRPGFEIIFVTKNELQAREACLLWGVVSVAGIGDAVTIANSHGLLKRGQRFINAARGRKEAAIELVR